MMSSKQRMHELLGCMILLLLFVTTKGQVETNANCGNSIAVVGQQFEITCTFTSAPVNGIRWRRQDGVSVATCVIGSNCFNTTGYSAVRGTLTNTLTIHSVELVDMGEWKCHDNDLTLATSTCNVAVKCNPDSSRSSISVSPEGKLERGSNFVVSVTLNKYCCTEGPNFAVVFSDKSSHQIPLANVSVVNNDTAVITIEDMKNEMCGTVILEQTCGGSPETVPGINGPELSINCVCRPVCIGFLVVSLILILLGAVWLAFVRFNENDYLEKLRIPSFAFGIVWLVIGIAGIVSIVVICKPLEPLQEVPCNGEYCQDVVIPSLFFNVLMSASGAALIILPFVICKPKGCVFLKIGSGDLEDEPKKEQPSQKSNGGATTNTNDNATNL